MPLLEIKNLQLEFGTGKDAVRAVDGVSFTIAEGETLCLVGESGCGKSVSALSIARLVPTPPARYVGGEIFLNGRDVNVDKRGCIAQPGNEAQELVSACRCGRARPSTKRLSLPGP